jgi:hypothetical protein
VKQLEFPADPVAFVKRSSYPQPVTESVIDALCYFIQDTLCEDEQDREDPVFSDSVLRDNINYSSISGPGTGTQNVFLTPFILFFDTVSYMDAPSWKLMEMVN